MFGDSPLSQARPYRGPTVLQTPSACGAKEWNVNMVNDVEMVVLADRNGRPAGSAPKASIHTSNTPLHFAFSCFLLDERGKLLVTRRALSKKTWPGVWTNSFCGHPAPGETTLEAVERRNCQELGCEPGSLHGISAILPDFSYRAVDSSGIVENEICPVFVAHLKPGAALDPHPHEVDSHVWIDPEALIAAVNATPFAFSPWLVEELADTRLQEAILQKRA